MFLHCRLRALVTPLLCLGLTAITAISLRADEELNPLAVTPTRLKSSPLGRTISTRAGWTHDRPSLYTRRTSPVRRNRIRRSIHQGPAA